MNWWRRFREFDNKGILIDRVEGSMAYTKRGYVFNRWIFRAYVVLVFLIILFIIMNSSAGWKEFYLHCPTQEEAAERGYVNYYGGWCDNPCYRDYDNDYCAPVADMELLPSGFTIGNPPSEELSRQVNGLVWIIISGFVLAFAVNHLGYNRGRPLEYILPENFGEEEL